MTATTPDPSVDEDLVAELAWAVLSQTAPEELLLFDETAAEYFEDPDRALAAGSGETTVGFGLELAMLTPMVLAVVTPVVKFLLSVFGEAAKDQARPVIKTWVQRVFKGTSDAPTEPAPLALTLEQGRRVHDIALEKALELKIPEQKAALLADAIAGRVWVAP